MGADADPPLLHTLAEFYESLPFDYILVGHCLIVASWFPRLRDRYLLSYWVRSAHACADLLHTQLLYSLVVCS